MLQTRFRDLNVATDNISFLCVCREKKYTQNMYNHFFISSAFNVCVFTAHSAQRQRGRSRCPDVLWWTGICYAFLSVQQPRACVYYADVVASCCALANMRVLSKQSRRSISICIGMEPEPETERENEITDKILSCSILRTTYVAMRDALRCACQMSCPSCLAHNMVALRWLDHNRCDSSAHYVYIIVAIVEYVMAFWNDGGWKQYRVFSFRSVLSKVAICQHGRAGCFDGDNL